MTARTKRFMSRAFVELASFSNDYRLGQAQALLHGLADHDRRWVHQLSLGAPKLHLLLCGRINRAAVSASLPPACVACRSCSGSAGGRRRCKRWLDYIAA